jgi:DNA-binding IclR family transcriptional regulator
VSRILSTLERLKWVIQLPDNTYGLSEKPLEFSLSVLSHIELKTVCRPYLAELNEITNETAALILRIGHEHISIDHIESNREVRYSVKLGFRDYLWRGANGKTMLANLDEDELKEVLDEFKKMGKVTLVSGRVLTIEKLLHELSEIRNQGFAISTGERTTEVYAVSSALFDHTNKVIGSIDLIGPLPRFNEKTARDYGPLVKQVAQKISLQLGATHH